MCAVFRRTLKAEGLKYTPERARILDAVIQAPGAFTAEDVLARLREGGAGAKASKATVYRTIKLLAQAGVIQQVLVQADQAHYVVTYGAGGGAIVVRTDDAGVEVIDAPELRAIVERVCTSRGLEAQGHRLMIFAARTGPAGSHTPR